VIVGWFFVSLLGAHLIIKRIKVFIKNPFDEVAEEIFENRLDENIEIVKGEELPERADFDILVSGRPDKVQIDASTKLSTIIIPWAGIPEGLRELLLPPEYSHISVHNLHHNATMVAEVALALLLAAAKHVILFDRSLRKHDWSPRYDHRTSIQLAGKTAVILGYGEIGQRIGKMLAAMDMIVVGIRRDPSKLVMEGAPDKIYGLEEIDELLPGAQILILALPLTEETEHLIDEGKLAMLPENALLVNVGRGRLVDQKALYDALKSGQLGGAGIDVWYHYPQETGNRTYTEPSDYPFHELENVVMSPHRAGLSIETELERAEALAQVLNAAARGERIPNQVNLQAGY
jgi:phosphoglycerate dehydrogenase-like enzyme